MYCVMRTSAPSHVYRRYDIFATPIITTVLYVKYTHYADIYTTADIMQSPLYTDALSLDFEVDYDVGDDNGGMAVGYSELFPGYPGHLKMPSDLANFVSVPYLCAVTAHVKWNDLTLHVVTP